MVSENLVGIIFKAFKNTPYPAITFVIIAAAYYIWTWSPILSQLDGDNATYLMSAKMYSPYSALSSVSAYFNSVSLYPPMYPLLLGFLGGGESILMAHLITTTFLLAAMLTLYWWMVSLNFNKLHAVVLVFVFAITPGTYLQSLSIHSENLFLLFSFLGIYFVSRKENSEDGKYLWIAAIFIGCTTLTRSAGVTLVFAFIVYLVINNENRKYYLSIIALLPMVLWGLLNNQDSDSYLDILSNYYTTDFIASLLQQLLNQSAYMLTAWHSIYIPGNSGNIIFNVFATISVLSVFFRIYKKKLDGIYILLYLLMVMSWPYPDELVRLLFPITPILLVQTSAFIKSIDENWRVINIFPAGNTVLIMTLIIVFLPNLLSTISRLNVAIDASIIQTLYKRTYDWYNPSIRLAINQVAFNQGIVASLEDAKKYVPDDECVYSIKPTLVGLFMDRVSKVPPETNLSHDEYLQIAERENCHYYFLVNATSPSYKESLYPYQKLGANLELIKIYYSPNNQVYPVSIIGKMKK